MMGSFYPAVLRRNPAFRAIKQPVVVLAQSRWGGAPKSGTLALRCPRGFAPSDTNGIIPDSQVTEPATLKPTEYLFVRVLGLVLRRIPI